MPYTYRMTKCYYTLDEATSLNSGEFRYSAVASGAKICSTIGSYVFLLFLTK